MQPQSQLLPPPSSTRYEPPNLSSTLFYPLRVCGRIWSTTGTLPKSLLSPLLVPATIFAGSLAAIGAVIAPLETRRYTQTSTPSRCSLLQQAQTDQQVKDLIQKRLTKAEIPCSVQVSSLERNYTTSPDYFSGYIHRNIVVQSTSSTLSRLWERVKLEFLNDTIPGIENLPYTLIFDNPVDQLKKILAVYQNAQFSLPFDLAYIRVEMYS